jgi:hypothetical protein
MSFYIREITIFLARPTFGSFLTPKNTQKGNQKWVSPEKVPQKWVSTNSNGFGVGF